MRSLMAIGTPTRGPGSLPAANLASTSSRPGHGPLIDVRICVQPPLEALAAIEVMEDGFPGRQNPVADGGGQLGDRPLLHHQLTVRSLGKIEIHGVPAGTTSGSPSGPVRSNMSSMLSRLQVPSAMPPSAKPKRPAPATPSHPRPPCFST